MTEARESQRERMVTGVMFAIIVVGWLMTVARPLLGPVGRDVTNSDIHVSAFWPVMFWCVCGSYLIRRPVSGVPLALRVFWPLGCAMLLLHIAIAFHLGHGWSHAAAWEHTKRIGGYGDGIFVNYTFALVWLLDAVWLAAAPASYLARPRWLHWPIHGFLAFVVVNAALVFGSWLARIAFAGWVVTCWFVLPRWQRWATRREVTKCGTTPVDLK